MDPALWRLFVEDPHDVRNGNIAWMKVQVGIGPENSSLTLRARVVEITRDGKLVANRAIFDFISMPAKDDRFPLPSAGRWWTLALCRKWIVL